MHYVYILLCSDDSFYTGYSTDPQKRLLVHQKGLGAAYTRSHPPLKIVYQESFPDKIGALKREAQIKGWTRAKKIATLNLCPNCPSP